MKYLKLDDMKFSNKTAFILVIVAYFFALGVRFYYYEWASKIKEFLWHGTLMINNPDGYYYAMGAKEILTNSHVVGDLAPIHSLPSIFTALIVKLFPFLTLDQVILWMPAIFGSLIVVPIFLIGRSLKNDVLGFVAALLGGIAWSYYNRTLVGYYDTDMFVITFLLFVVWGIVEYFENNKEWVIYFVPLLIVLYEWWYPQCRAILLATIFITFLYAIIKKEKKFFVFVGILFISLSNFKWYLNLSVVLILFGIYKNKKELFFKNIYVFYFLIFIILALSGSFNLLGGEFMAYLKINESENKLHFYQVLKTVSEASAIPYSLVAKRISGGVGIFIFSAIGYLLLLLRYPIIVISIPSVIVGLLAHKLGLRFTIYAVPFFALGFAYLVLLIARDVSEFFKNYKKPVFYVTFGVLSIYALYKNIEHIIVYKVPATFLNQEVASIDKISKIASKKDYFFTWWDYGYPLRYYSHLKTVADGGKHSGEVNYPISYALTRNQVAASNIARLDVEYTDKFEVARELGKEFKTEGFLPDMMKKYGYKDINEFLKALNSPNFKLPKKTRDIYFYLPFRMFDIFPTIAVFSYVDLKTGKVHMPLIISTSVISTSKGGVRFSNGMLMDSRGVLYIKNNQIPVNSIYLATYNKNGKYLVLQQKFFPQSNIIVLWYQPLNKVLIIDKKLLNSTFVQLFFFQKYNKTLFKPVIINPFVKIYKLKK